MTIILLPSFLDANSVERIAIDVCTAQGEERISRINSQLILATKKVF